jgi:ribulose-5-phosphate 4-epimerase/fuculose-1-phosphate aldolase
MIKGGFPGINFQTFYVSKEISNCPLIGEIVRIGKKFKDKGIIEDQTDTTISLSYGKRVLINANENNFKEIKQEDFLEIVDYDPLKRVILTMGPGEPRFETPVHWLIHHARDEVNAVIQINNLEIAKRFENKIPTTEKEYPIGSLEQAKEVLKNLRDSKKVIIKNLGILFVGDSIQEVEGLVLKTFEESK